MANPSYQFHPFYLNVDHPYWDGIVPAGANEGWADKYKSTGQELKDGDVDIDAVIKRFGVDVIDELHNDYQKIHELRFGSITPADDGEQKLYAATAGSPCVGKSWELDRVLEESSKTDARYANILQVDPDRWVMLQMGMYQKLLDAGATPEEAYTICRPASNIIANMLLNEGVKRGFHIAQGATWTGGHAASFFKNIGAQDYYRRLIAVDAPLKARLEMRDHRIESEGFYQVTAKDFKDKAGAFYDRMPDYLNPACIDHLTLLWKPSLAEPVQTIFANGSVLDDEGRFNEAAYDAFAARYDEYRGAQNKPFAERLPTLSQLISMRYAAQKNLAAHPQLKFR